MESGTNKDLKILLISSGIPKDNSPKMAIDMVEALKNDGHIVDLLLKYPAPGMTNINAIYKDSDIHRHNIINNLKSKSLAIKRRLLGKRSPKAKYYFFHSDENRPPVKPRLILNKIEKDYDLVLIFFWQGMITSKSILDIYAKLKVPIFLIAADLFPMTGGCSYFWECRNFEKSCGSCPALGSNDENDYTRKIFLYKKEVYDIVNPVLLSNSWVIEHAKRSGLFKNLDNLYPVINKDIFKPYAKDDLKTRYNVNDKILLFIGAVNIVEERKGFVYLVEALSKLIQKSPMLKEKIVLIAAGNSDVNLRKYFSFEVIMTGHLSFEQLARHYSACDIYLSSTIQDAGPMMVNQALMCGTPVVAFRIGTACDVVNDSTGYIARYKDTDDFSDGILKLLMLNDNEKIMLSIKCREMALRTSSYEAFANQIKKVYQEMKNKT